jgi:DNA-binding transcriptional LysR family regulator
MELRQLEHFVAVASEKHFGNAALDLRMSQSGLSASIRALESELGVGLFVRSTRHVALTPAGAALLPEAQALLAGAGAAKAAVNAASGELGGVVRVGTESCPGVVKLANELAVFREHHPRVEMRLRVDGSGPLLTQVANGRVDAAIVVPTEAAPASIELSPLGREPLVVLSHRSRPFVQRGHVALDDLADETFVDFQEGASSRVLTARAFEERGLAYRPDLEVNDVHTLLDLIDVNLGIAIVPQAIARKRAVDFAATPISHPMPVWEVCVAVRVGANPATRALRDQLRAQAVGVPEAVEELTPVD